MFINNSKENWTIFKNAVQHVEKVSNDKQVVTRMEAVTNDMLREVERVATANPEGNFTPAIIGQIMAHDIAQLSADTITSIISKRRINNSDIADLAAQIADYTVALANLAYQKIEPKLIEKQLAEFTA